MITIMLKKQIILLISLLLLAFSSTAAAANWQWVASDENVGVFFDTESLRFGKIDKLGIDKNIVYVWWYMALDDAFSQKQPYNGEIVKKIVRYDKLNLNEQTITGLEVILRDTDGFILGQKNNTGTEHIAPDSRAALMYSAVKEYARIHAEEITERSIK